MTKPITFLLDGRERDRKTVSIGNDLAPLADAVTTLLTPPPYRPWYRSKWTWAAGGAAIAAAAHALRGLAAS